MPSLCAVVRGGASFLEITKLQPCLDASRYTPKRTDPEKPLVTSCRQAPVCERQGRWQRSLSSKARPPPTPPLLRSLRIVVPPRAQLSENIGEVEAEDDLPHMKATVVYSGASDARLKDGAAARNGSTPTSFSSPSPSPSPSPSDSAPATASVSGAAPLSPPPCAPGSPPSSPGGSRPGLFRTPISGGVQSATSSHDLPRPEVAVRNLMESARFAHLCTVMSRMHHRRRGYPFGSLVDYTSDAWGHPIFSLSPLAIHTRNLLADPRCTLVVQMPGWSGLANARVTLFGDVYPLPPEEQEAAQKCFSAKHQTGASQQWGNFSFFRMDRISDIYFVGGFGTVAWVDVGEYESAKPDAVAYGGDERLHVLNGRFSLPMRRLLSDGGTEPVDDAALISIDSKGVDVRVRQGARFNVQRVSFGCHVTSLEEASAALRLLLGPHLDWQD